MKKIIIFVASSFAILAISACTNIAEEAPESITKNLTFTATQEGLSLKTKTMRIEDGSTWWQPAEEISVFYGSGSNGGSKFTSKNNTLQETVEFEGSITISGSGKDFWAVYPYSTDNACDGNSITTVIPAYQMGSEGNFSGDAFPTIAKSNTLDLAFWNICGGIKFFVSRNDIVSITFKGNNGETLAGKVKVAFNDSGVPAVTEVINGISEVTLAIPDGTPFKAGKYYYLTLLPGALESGFTMTFTTATEQGTLVSNKPQTVKRSIFGVLKSIDSKVSEWESRWVEPEWVDLGLSVKWATFNVGACKPEDYGSYFAWGETEPKDEYTLSNYKWYNTSSNSYSKYNYDSSIGLVDNKLQLDPEDDAAFTNWGENWRMPSVEEYRELFNNCSCKRTTLNGVYGQLFTSKIEGYNDKSIFLPAAGCREGIKLLLVGTNGFYWSSSLHENYPNNACAFFDYSLGSMSVRWEGFPVRPVNGAIVPVSNITIPETLNLVTGRSATLTASLLPENATFKGVTWHSSNNSIAIVNSSGYVTAVAAGTATITVFSADGTKSASCEVTVTEPTMVEGYEYVDLGLSVKWATFNIGATAPEENGSYFAWGETEPKDEYTLSNYKWYNTSSNSYSKYNYDSSIGLVDNKLQLDPEDDAAFTNWGENWRMPSVEEYRELFNNCSCKRTTLNGVYGQLFTSKIEGYNDKSIFLPAAGCREGIKLLLVGTNGFYWSSSLHENYPNNACAFFDYSLGSMSVRWEGFPVRPVYDDRIHPDTGEDGDFSSNVTWTSGSDSAYDQTAYVNGSKDISVLKLGTSTKYGKSTLTLPAGSKKLSFYAVSWNNTAIADLVFTVNGTQVATVTPKANSGLKSNAPYTLTVDDDDRYTISLGSQTNEVTVETSGGGCRAALFGIVAN